MINYNINPTINKKKTDLLFLVEWYVRMFALFLITITLQNSWQIMNQTLSRLGATADNLLLHFVTMNTVCFARGFTINIYATTIILQEVRPAHCKQVVRSIAAGQKCVNCCTIQCRHVLERRDEVCRRLSKSR